MNRWAMIAASTLTGLIVGLAVIVVAPSTTPYSMVNEGPLGYSNLYNIEGASPLNIEAGLDGLNPTTTIILLSRTKPLDDSLAKSVWQYMYTGGILIATGSTSFLNTLLEQMGVDATIDNGTIYDMVFNAGNRSLVVAETLCSVRITLYEPHPIYGYNSPLAYTSNYSYVDENGNGYLDLSEQIGGNTVALEHDIGRGKLVIISSPYVFTNNLIEYNQKFLDCLLKDRRLNVDQSEALSNPFEYFKLQVRYQASQGNNFLATIIALVMGVTSYAVAKRI